MDRRGLNDRAARRDEPVETFALRRLPDWTSVSAAGAARRNRSQMHPHRLHIERRIERQQSRLIQLNACFEKRSVRTREYHSSIDKLLALYFRYDANHRIVIPGLLAHASPPQQTGAARRAAA